MSSWNRLRSQQYLLPNPQHDQNLLPVPRRAGRLVFGLGRLAGNGARESSAGQRSGLRVDQQIVSEFRSKLKMAEDLISKLAFSLREIQGMRRKPKAKKADRKKPGQVVGHIGLAAEAKDI